MLPTEIAYNYNDIVKLRSFPRRLNSIVRDSLIFFLSSYSRIDLKKEWVRFPFYHHVFDDEREDFNRHLKFFKNHGDFISLNDAVEVLKNPQKIGGRYFCITFDDGFKNCVTNALNILVDNNCYATFFIPTEFIGCDLYQDRKKIQTYFINSSYPSQILIEFMDWEDCRILHNFGMIIGAHTCKHVPLSMLTIEQAKEEMLLSKKKIEKELGVKCLYFSPPWGIPGKDFDINIHPILAREIGFLAFLTSERGVNYLTADPFVIKRDFLYAKWQNFQLRYFFS